MMTVGNRRRPNAKAYGHKDRVWFITIQPTEMNHINTPNEDYDEKIYNSTIGCNGDGLVLASCNHS
jgi:hypothetical protein